MNRTQPRGVVALLTVIILGSVMLTLGIASTLSGHVQVIVAGQSAIANDVRELAATCLEESVHRLKRDSAYVGGTVPLGANTCTVAVSGSGITRTISAAATVDGYTKTLSATLTRKQNAALNSNAWAVTAWSELDPP